MNVLRARSLSIGARLAALSCTLVALLFLAFSWALTQAAGTQVREQVMKQVDGKNRSIGEMISVVDQTLTAEVGRSMTLFASFLPGPFTIDENAKIDVNGVATPTFKAGERVLNLDFTIPDQFLERSGAVATVFVRNGDEFIRVTTSLKKQDGSRAIGTLRRACAVQSAPAVGGNS